MTHHVVKLQSASMLTVEFEKIYYTRQNLPIKEIGFWTLSIVQIFNRLNTQRFGDWICLRPQVKRKRGKKAKNPILLGPLEKANLNHWIKSRSLFV
jgi:hypothetical protein